jgi:hypothetical protein
VAAPLGGPVNLVIDDRDAKNITTRTLPNGSERTQEVLFRDTGIGVNANLLPPGSNPQVNLGIRYDETQSNEDKAIPTVRTDLGVSGKVDLGPDTALTGALRGGKH